MQKMACLTRTITGHALGNSFKENLGPANQVFYTFFAIEGFSSMACILMIQIPHLNFFQILVLLFNLVFLLVAPPSLRRLFEIAGVHFDLSYANSIKLSLIGMLLDIRPVLKLILGTALLGVISYYMPALLFFVLIGVWHFFVNDIFDPVYQNIHENWYPNDEKNLVKYAFKILRLCHGGHFDHYGPGCLRGSLGKTSKLKPTGSPNGF